MREERKARFPWVPVLLFAAAAVLIALSAVGSVRAALTEESGNYVGSFAVQNIGVAIKEGTDLVEGSGALLQNLVPAGEKFSLGTEYGVDLAAVNTGDIDQYVRVAVYKYWVDEDGRKITSLDPALIRLTFGEGWLDGGTTESGERTMLYYPNIVAPGESTAPFVTAVEIDKSLASKVSRTETQTDTGTVIATTYEYDGVRFVVEAEADAVQTHSARDAIKAAWGVDAAVDAGGVITAIR